MCERVNRHYSKRKVKDWIGIRQAEHMHFKWETILDLIPQIAKRVAPKHREEVASDHSWM